MRPHSAAAILQSAGTPAFLLTNRANVRYLAGCPLDEDARILVTPRRLMLFVGALSRQNAERRAAASLVVRDTADFAEAMAAVPVCGFEAEDVTVARAGSWKKKLKTNFVRKADPLRQFRRSKEPDELAAMRRADRITKELLRRVPSVLRRAVTEQELARRITIWALELGAEGMSFDPIVAFGSHTSSPHHRPTTRALQKGHLVQIDIGVKVRGYCSDASEVYFTQTPTAEQERTYRTLVRAQKKAMSLLRPGVTNRALDAAARAVLAEQGIEHAFCHGLGHGVGLEIHEGVSLSQRAPEEKLLKHEVVTIEPGVYFPGKWGMRVEKMLVVE